MTLPNMLSYTKCILRCCSGINITESKNCHFLIKKNLRFIFNVELNNSVFFSTLGLGPEPLELGKLATKLEFLEISHFNKPFRLEVCLRYLNNYNNEWMPVLSIGEIKYMITLHKKISYSFFKRNFGFGNFSGNFGKI